MKPIKQNTYSFNDIHHLAFVIISLKTDLSFQIEVRHHCLSRRLQNLFERLKMRVSSIRRGLEFGKLATVRGQTKYHLSPFEQRAFAGAIATGVPNTLWRIRTNIFYWLPRKLFLQL